MLRPLQQKLRTVTRDPPQLSGGSLFSVLFYERLTSGTVTASAVIYGDVVSAAFAVIIVLAVASFAADVGCGACGDLVHAVTCSTSGSIGTAGSFAAGRCASSGNIDGG